MNWRRCSFFEGPQHFLRGCERLNSHIGCDLPNQIKSTSRECIRDEILGTWDVIAPEVNLELQENVNGKT